MDPVTSRPPIELVDTHCHLQFADYGLDPEQTLLDAAAAGVTTVIAVGCALPDSQAAVKFAAQHPQVWASIGLHPHEGARYVDDHAALQAFRELANKPKVVAIGETGLDYYYEHSPKADQIKLLRYQLDLAMEHNLPLIFHVRDAFDDFWPIYDEYAAKWPQIRGIIHSFTADTATMEAIIKRGLYIGINGIATFTKRADQLTAIKNIPLKNLVLETDAPFLTPAPFRGTINESKHVRTTGEFLAHLRGEPFETLAAATSANAKEILHLL